jgi:hypothetical protein
MGSGYALQKRVYREVQSYVGRICFLVEGRRIVLETISGAILGGALVFSVIYLLGRIEYWKGSYEAAVKDLEEAVDGLSKADREVQALTDKHESVMTVFRQMGERPVVAALSDKHIEQIVSALAMIATQNQSPNRIN